MNRKPKQEPSRIAQVGKVLLGAALIAVEKVLGKDAAIPSKRPRAGGTRKKAAKRSASASQRKAAPVNKAAPVKARGARKASAPRSAAK